MPLGCISSILRKSPLITVLVLIISICLLTLLILKLLLSPIIFEFLFSYIWYLIVFAFNDYQRFENVQYITIMQEFKLHEMEMTFNQEICKHSTLSNTKTAWLTATLNDDYAIGAVFLGYILRRLSCHHKMIALTSDGVSKGSIDALKKVGYDVRLVEPLDCNWMDRKKGIPERNKGIPGTHMRFHAWNYTEFDNIVYLDTDVFPLHNVDEIFSLSGEIAASYGSRPGLLDPSFNAGLLMFKPSKKSYNEILSMWESYSNNGQCPDDQRLLWHYYVERGLWTPLPYVYNVRRYVYHPMKVYHFACCLTEKPWRYKNFDRDLAVSFKGPLQHPQDMVMLWWKYFFEALDIYDLHEWFNKVSENRKG